MKKALINRETNSIILDEKILTEDVKLLFPYKDDKGVTDKSKVDIIYKDGRKLLEVDVEYVGEDKLDVDYIERHLA